MYPAAKPKAKVVYKKPPFVDEDYFLGRVFIREAAIIRHRNASVQ